MKGKQTKNKFQNVLKCFFIFSIAILVLYFRFVLYYSDDAATQMYHIFAMCCYFTPVLGAIIADSLLGKFW